MIDNPEIVEQLREIREILIRLEETMRKIAQGMGVPRDG